MKGLLGTFIALAFALAGSSASIAQNILPNGNFGNADGISGWVSSGTGSIAFNPRLDIASSSLSGSLQLSISADFTPEDAASRCFPVTPGASYAFGGQSTAANNLGLITAARLSCKSFSDANCSQGTTELGAASQSSDGDFPGPFIPLLPIRGTLGADAHSAQCVAEAFVALPNPFASPLAVQVDGLFFDSPNSSATAVTLNGSLSGSWYDPSQSGQGFMLEFTNQANTLIASWLTYAPNGGGQVWIYGQDTYDPSRNSVTVVAVLTSGAKFTPLFNKQDVQKTPWGYITFSFSDCNHAVASWHSFLPEYPDGSMQLIRMTTIEGSTCPR